MGSKTAWRRTRVVIKELEGRPTECTQSGQQGKWTRNQESLGDLADNIGRTNVCVIEILEMKLSYKGY